MANSRTILIALAMLVGVTAGGCEGPTAKQDAGAVLGMIAGGVLGATIGDGAGQAVASIVGAAAGGIVGQMIGADMDEADRLKAEAAARAALQVPVGDSVEWRSERNTAVRGTATPLAETSEPDGRECRTVRQVAYIDGQEVTETTRFCRVGDSGTWAPT